MKHAAKIIWNVLLLAFVGFWVWAIIPKVIGQFSDFDQLPAGTFKTRVVMIGFQGIGLLSAIAACSASLSSFFWRRISFFWRVLFGGILAVFVIGTIVAIRIDLADMGFAPYPDYVTFVVSSGLFLLPLVLLGRGYPDLAIAAYAKLRRGPNAEFHKSPKSDS